MPAPAQCPATPNAAARAAGMRHLAPLDSRAPAAARHGTAAWEDWHANLWRCRAALPVPALPACQQCRGPELPGVAWLRCCAGPPAWQGAYLLLHEMQGCLLQAVASSLAGLLLHFIPSLSVRSEGCSVVPPPAFCSPLHLCNFPEARMQHEREAVWVASPALRTLPHRGAPVAPVPASPPLMHRPAQSWDAL